MEKYEKTKNKLKKQLLCPISTIWQPLMFMWSFLWLRSMKLEHICSIWIQCLECHFDQLQLLMRSIYLDWGGRHRRPHAWGNFSQLISTRGTYSGIITISWDKRTFGSRTSLMSTRQASKLKYKPQLQYRGFDATWKGNITVTRRLTVWWPSQLR